MKKNRRWFLDRIERDWGVKSPLMNDDCLYRELKRDGLPSMAKLIKRVVKTVKESTNDTKE